MNKIFTVDFKYDLFRVSSLESRLWILGSPFWARLKKDRMISIVRVELFQESLYRKYLYISTGWFNLLK